MGIPKRFYYSFGEYVRDRGRGLTLILDALDEAFTRKKRQDPALRQLLTDFFRDPNVDSRFAHWVLEFGKGRTGVFAALLIGVALDADLNRQESFRFFLCFWITAVFVNPPLIEK